MQKFIAELPKAELHVHIEGTLEPEQMFDLAKRNGITLPYQSVTEVKAAYQFNKLQDFLDIYYTGANVLQTEQDFYDLMWAYLTKAHSQHILYAEIFFDPQTHTARDISFDTVIQGLHRAQRDAENQLGIVSQLIMCFLRHLPESDALTTLEHAIPYKELILGVGLDSSEKGNPPQQFQTVYQKAAQHGFKLVAHAGEEGPADYVRQAVQLLNVARIDHGNHALDDHVLVEELVRKQIPLTMCPLSNVKLAVVDNMTNHPIKKMLDLGLLVMLNSDDPAYFGGYLNENFMAVQQALNLSQQDMYQLAKNSFIATFLPEERKQHYLQQLDDTMQHLTF